MVLWQGIGAIGAIIVYHIVYTKEGRKAGVDTPDNSAQSV
uniref:Uncharacterized protein n=1 Tax=Arundo donax TaxID=35708 RepID=A0A0A8ZI26_ARUDO